MIQKRLEALLAGVWEDLTDDLVGPITLSRGSKGSDPLARMAGGGALNFALNNSEDNSAGVVGYYSPRNANKRAGWQDSVQIRFTLIDGVTEYVHHRGWLDRIIVTPGEAGVHPVQCVSRTWLHQANKHEVRDLATLVDVTADEALTTLLTKIPVQPFATSFDVGTDELPFVFDDIRGATFLGAIARLVFTEMGYGYELRDGTLRFENRTRRFTGGFTPDVTIEDPRDLDVQDGQSMRGNLVLVTVAPREAPDVVEVLAEITKSIPIAPGETVRIQLKFKDPGQELARIGGHSMIDPVATTDYLFNSNSNGTGADLTAFLDVTATFGGDTVTLDLENTGGTSGHVTQLEVRGKPLYTYKPIAVEARDQASIDDTGERAVPVDMPYQPNVNVARAAADALLVAVQDPGHAKSVTFLAEDYPEEVLLTRDIGHDAAIDEPVSGLEDDPYFINGVDVRFEAPGVTWITWHTVRADVGRYWELGIEGYSELGVTTFVGPF